METTTNTEMTKEEFYKTRFGAGSKCFYKGVVWNVVAVDFEEELIAIPNEEGITVEVADQMQWIRCENAEMIK